jgi:Ca2+-binding EF-hand superfamily protein
VPRRKGPCFPPCVSDNENRKLVDTLKALRESLACGMSSLRPMRATAARKQARAAFRRHDRTGNGELDDMEIRYVLKELKGGKRATESDVHFLKLELDADRDNIITEDEFTAW